MTEHLHTFPIPAGWSPEQAWEHHCRGQRLPIDRSARWVNLTIQGGAQDGPFWRGGKLIKWEDA